MLEGVIGMLTFFVTVLGLVIAVILIGMALLRRRWARARGIGVFFLGWLGVYAAILLVVSLTSQPRTIPPGVERCFDEMCYSVQALKISHTLGEGANSLTAGGNFYILTVQLRSAAKRSAQRPSQPDIFFIDGGGKQYTHLVYAGPEGDFSLGQPVTAGQLWSQPIQPGKSQPRMIAVDLPADIRQAGMVITEGIGPLSVIIIGDENSFLHARTVFSLSP